MKKHQKEILELLKNSKPIKKVNGETYSSGRKMVKNDQRLLAFLCTNKKYINDFMDNSKGKYFKPITFHIDELGVLYELHVGEHIPTAPFLVFLTKKKN